MKVVSLAVDSYYIIKFPGLSKYLNHIFVIKMLLKHHPQEDETTGQNMTHS